VLFGRIPLDRAAGAILAHTTRLDADVLPKGHILTATTIERLRAAGHATITGALLEPGDVPENEAAGRVADALGCDGVACARPGTGRANLLATRAGLFRADAERINAINALHEGLTVATLADATPVIEGTLLATIKIIPFAIPGHVLAQAEIQARARPSLRLPPFRPLSVGLIVSELPGLKAAALRRTVEVTEKRVRALTGTLLPPLRVAHEEQAVAGALRMLLAQGAALLLVAGASATVDRSDVAPSAIVRAGGTVDHFGMPVDPGNLICLGHIGAVPALVLPGCARSPALNGIDLVLARVFAGEPLASTDIARMGVGGLLKEFAARPVPRHRARPADKLGAAYRVGAVVLAAGLSRRMAPRNKLLLPDAAGTKMIARTVDAVLASRARPVCVVVGHQAEDVTAALAGRPVTIVPARDYAAGLSSSLRAGVAALPPHVRAAVICLGDMPLVTAADIDRLLDAYDPDQGRTIIVPVHQGVRGNPVVWDRAYFASIAALRGDAGARHLLAEHVGQITEVEMPTDAVLRDFDTPEMLADQAGMT
jgi:molybdenum cofactor cytidylyltransferase